MGNYTRGFLREEDLAPSSSITENLLRMVSPIRIANALAPVARNEEGNFEFALPSAIADPIESWKGMVDRHRAGIQDDEADVRDAFNVAGSVGLGSVAATPLKPSNALGAMGAKGARAAQDLPMDLASRMARAKEMGFDVDRPLYHGTNADFDAFEIGDVGYHFGSPEQANKRLRWVQKNVGEDNHKVLPVYLRKGKSLDLPDVGQWNDPETLINNIINTPWGKSHKYKLNDLLGEAEEIKPQYENVDAWTASPEAHNILSDIRTMMENEGYDSVRYLNEVENTYGKFGSLSPEAEREINARQSQIKDLEKKYVKPLPENIKTSEDIEKWLAEPPPVMSDEDKSRIQQLHSEIRHLDNIGRSDPHSYIVFDPRNIRSVNAAFDPAKSESANLLAANPYTSSAIPLAIQANENKRQPFYGGWGPKWGQTQPDNALSQY